MLPRKARATFTATRRTKTTLLSLKRLPTERKYYEKNFSAKEKGAILKTYFRYSPKKKINNNKEFYCTFKKHFEFKESNLKQTQYASYQNFNMPFLRNEFSKIFKDLSYDDIIYRHNPYL